MARFTFRQFMAAAALLAVFSMQQMQAQQVATPDKAANAAAGQAPANPAFVPTQVSVAGAPSLKFRPSAAASAKPAVQAAAAAPELKLDPITHAPFSSLASRPAVAEEAFAGEANSQEATLASDGSLHQGLKVHGHWVINILNPDGTQVQHHEFENSLEGSAQGFLVGLLSGYMVPGDWMIVLGAQSGNGPCTATYEYCGIVHNAATYPAQGYCNSYYCTGSTLNYTYNFGTDFAGPYSIVLSGTITANETGTIGSVFTLLNTCANIAYSSTANPSSIETSSPATCVTQTAQQPWYGPFTDTNITPIAVTDGQLIQAIVTITFS